MTSDYARLRRALDEPLSTVACCVEAQSRTAARRLPAAPARVVCSGPFLIDAVSEACAYFSRHYDPARNALKGYAYVCARRGIAAASRLHLGTRWRDGIAYQVWSWLETVSLDQARGGADHEKGEVLLSADRFGAILVERRRPGRHPASSPLVSFESLVANLSPVERYVVVMRFEHGRTLAEIGRSLAMTRENVRVIQRRALARIADFGTPFA